MNHLYGRLGINEIREIISFTPNEKYKNKIHSVLDYKTHEIRLYSHEKRIKTYSNPALSSFVTSYARLKMYEQMEKINFDVYYMDTDSLFTPRKMKSTKELGEMKLEYQLKEACFLLPKTYCGREISGDLIKKMKGFPQKNINHISYQDFVESLSGEIRMVPVKIGGGLAGIKTAMRKGEILHVLPDSTKQLRSRYDKRIIIKKGKNYSTIPINVEHSQSILQ